MTGEEEHRCEVCGRALRSTVSRERGRGRVCDEKVNPGRGRDHSPRPASAPRRRRSAPPAIEEPCLLDELLEQP